MVDGFPELLASRGSAHSEAKAVALAHIPRTLHLWFGRGHSRNRAFGEIDILANTEECV